MHATSRADFSYILTRYILYIVQLTWVKQKFDLHI